MDWQEELVGAQAMIWFVLAAGATVLGLSALFRRYVRREPHAVHSRGGFTLFAAVLFLFALFAVASGYVAMGNGR